MAIKLLSKRKIKNRTKVAFYEEGVAFDASGKPLDDEQDPKRRRRLAKMIVEKSLKTPGKKNPTSKTKDGKK